MAALTQFFNLGHFSSIENRFSNVNSINKMFFHDFYNNVG